LSAINHDYRLLRSGKTGFRAGAQYKDAAFRIQQKVMSR
jgi:hypothetical protein